MHRAHFQPRLLEAECELWFEPAPASWESTEPQLAACLMDLFPAEDNFSLPWLWLEPNSLIIRSELLPGEAAAHRARILAAWTLYHQLSISPTIRSLFLRYLFSMPLTLFPGAHQRPFQVQHTPQGRLTVQASPQGYVKPTRVTIEVRYLVTRPSQRAASDTVRWLDDLHDALETAFQDLLSEPQSVKLRR